MSKDDEVRSISFGVGDADLHPAYFRIDEETEEKYVTYAGVRRARQLLRCLMALDRNADRMSEEPLDEEEFQDWASRNDPTLRHCARWLLKHGIPLPGGALPRMCFRPYPHEQEG